MARRQAPSDRVPLGAGDRQLIHHPVAVIEEGNRGHLASRPARQPALVCGDLGDLPAPRPAPGLGGRAEEEE